MKTVRLANNEIKRLDNDNAAKLVAENKAVYVAKKVWKAEVRNETNR